MSVYKCHAFIFLDQPPPWLSRTLPIMIFPPPIAVLVLQLYYNQRWDICYFILYLCNIVDLWINCRCADEIKLKIYSCSHSKLNFCTSTTLSRIQNEMLIFRFRPQQILYNPDPAENGGSQIFRFRNRSSANYSVAFPRSIVEVQKCSSDNIPCTFLSLLYNCIISLPFVFLPVLHRKWFSSNPSFPKIQKKRA